MGQWTIQRWTVMQLLLFWPVLHRSSPPDVCNSVADYHQAADLDKVFFNNHHDLLKTLHHGRPHQEPNLINSNSNSKEAGNNDNSFQFHFKHSSRSLSVIGYVLSQSTPPSSKLCLSVHTSVYVPWMLHNFSSIELQS